MIVASSENDVIGKDNKLMWRIEGDLKRFRKLTERNTVIMGRKTYESIGKALPNRLNIVVTRDKNKSFDGAISVNSIEEAIRKSPNDRKIFIIGGSEIYEQSLKYTDTIYMTKVHCEVDGDSYFKSSDELTECGFILLENIKNYSSDVDEYDYSYIKYKRSRNY